MESWRNLLTGVPIEEQPNLIQLLNNQQRFIENFVPQDPGEEDKRTLLATLSLAAVVQTWKGLEYNCKRYVMKQPADKIIIRCECGVRECPAHIKKIVHVLSQDRPIGIFEYPNYDFGIDNTTAEIDSLLQISSQAINYYNNMSVFHEYILPYALFFFTPSLNANKFDIKTKCGIIE